MTYNIQLAQAKLKAVGFDTALSAETAEFKNRARLKDIINALGVSSVSEIEFVQVSPFLADRLNFWSNDSKTGITCSGGIPGEIYYIPLLGLSATDILCYVFARRAGVTSRKEDLVLRFPTN